MSDTARHPCPACDEPGGRIFWRQEHIPVNSVLLLESAAEARDFPTGTLHLTHCPHCGFIFNDAFDAGLSEYSARYEETQGFSGVFQRFATELAARWVAAHDLAGRKVLEIGCGKGEFLELMVEAGVGHGTGIDPSYHPERTRPDLADRLEFITDFYSEAYTHLRADAVVCRHTLEHISPVRQFMETVRRSIGDHPEVAVLFELPDTTRVLRDVALEDVYYEHCSYFTAGSLSRLFRRCGFDVTGLDVVFGGQYVLIEARPGTGHGTPAVDGEDDLDEIAAFVDRFEKLATDKVAIWRRDLAAWRRDGRRAVIWGGGSKGVSYLTTTGDAADIHYAVDINPNKQGRFMARTAQQVVGPEFLTDYQPDVVIAMNAIYLDEIRADLDRLGVGAELTAV